MLSKLTERKIAQLFYVMGVRESEIERSRETLCKNLDFEPYTAFKHLDSAVNSSISPYDIQLFLSSHSVTSDLSQVQLLVSQYDRNLDGRLSLNEFLALVLPSTNEYLKDSTSLRTPLSGMTLEVQYILIRLLELELVFHEEVEKLRTEITSANDFSLLESFRVIDDSKKSLIDRLSIRNFVSKNGFYINDNEISAVLRRVDNDNDGGINYVEFVDMVMPKKSRNISPMKNNFRTTSPRRNSSPLRQVSPSKKYFIDEGPVERRTTAYNDNIYRNAVPLRKVDSPSRRSSPLRRTDSPLRRTSPLRQSSPIREHSYQKTSSPLKESFTSQSIYRNSPLRNQVSTYSRIDSPLRSSPLRRASPLRRSSPVRESPSRTFHYNASPNRSQSNSYSASFYSTGLRNSPPKTLNCYNISPKRNSSPLRLSPSRKNYETSDFGPGKSAVSKGSPLRSSYLDKNFEGDIVPQRQSPLKSMPLRNTKIRQNAESPLKNSPLKNSSVDLLYSSSSKFTQSLRNSNL